MAHGPLSGEVENHAGARPSKCIITFLERMHSRLQKQVAFNQRVLQDEELISGTNVEPSGYLQRMEINMPLYACVNVGERGEEHNRSVVNHLHTKIARWLPYSNR
jgi:hypothetical protein